jgi:hypothetical protein
MGANSGVQWDKVHVYEGFYEDLARLFQRQLGFRRHHTWVSVSSHMGFSHRRSVLRLLYIGRCTVCLDTRAHQPCLNRIQLTSTINDLHKSLYERSSTFQSPFLFSTAYLDNDAPTLDTIPLLTFFSRLGDSARRPPEHGGSCGRGFAGLVE